MMVGGGGGALSSPVAVKLQRMSVAQPVNILVVIVFMIDW